jgi:hypothetical protein
MMLDYVGVRTRYSRQAESLTDDESLSVQNMQCASLSSGEERRGGIAGTSQIAESGRGSSIANGVCKQKSRRPSSYPKPEKDV